MPPFPDIPMVTDWVLANGFRGTDLPPGQLARFPSDVGAVEVGFHALGEGAFVLDVQSHFHVPVTVGAKILFDEPILALRLPLCGRAVIRNADTPAFEETAGTWNLSLVTDSGCLIDNTPGAPYAALTSVFSLGRLRACLDGEGYPAPIGRFLDGTSDPFGTVGRGTEKTRRLARQLRDTPYQGAIASLYREGKVYQLLAEIFSELSGRDTGTSPTSSRDRQAALDARDILLADLANPPPIAVLARRVGLSQRRLNAIFRDVFGAAPFDCLTRWRLDQARDLLARGDLSVKQVSYLLGYAHVSSFVHAFARRFGQPPGGWRSEMSDRGETA